MPIQLVCIHREYTIRNRVLEVRWTVSVYVNVTETTARACFYIFNLCRAVHADRWIYIKHDCVPTFTSLT